MRRTILFSAAALALGALAIFGLRWLVYDRFIETTDNAYVKADTVAISAKTPGRIEAVVAAENAIVHEGDVLARIAVEDYAARAEEARADLSFRQASLATLDNQAALAAARVDEARASLKSAEAKLTLSRSDYERYRALADSKVATRQKLDQTLAALKSSEADVDRAKAALAAAQAEAAVLESQKQETKAAVDKAKAALELAELDARDVLIRAPTSGVVGNISARPGQYARPGQQLMVLVPIAEAYIVANFKETQIARIRPGDPVRIRADAYPGASIAGEVDSFSPASGAEFSLLPPENATGNFTKIVQRVPIRVRIVSAPDDVVLLPGLSVTASVDTRRLEGVKSTALFAPPRETEAASTTLSQ